MENIIVVGTGDVFQKFIAPALEVLEVQQLVKVIATVDIKKRDELEYLSERIKHRIRLPEESLSFLLADLKEKNPLVIIAHSIDFHYQDAKDLVDAGFRIMLETPYVANKSEFEPFKKLVLDNPKKVFLFDYYFLRKMAPLFLLLGIIKEDSFYFGYEGVFKDFEDNRSLNFFRGKFEEVIGSPLSIKVKILESQGDAGKLDHRGAHLFDIRRGGGMLHEMGLHTLMPVFALKDYIGKVDKFLINCKINIAGSKSFYEMAKKKYNIPEEYIGETYAEVSLVTDKGIPIDIAVGKYLADIPTQKSLVLYGTKGKLCLDMHENYMNIYKDHELIGRINLPNTKRDRYYPVIRSGLEYFKENCPFTINLSEIQTSAQELILNIREKSRENSSLITTHYEEGEKYKDIFKKEN